jgi:hypothetical protein
VQLRALEAAAAPGEALALPLEGGEWRLLAEAAEMHLGVVPALPLAVAWRLLLVTELVRIALGVEAGEAL